MAKIYLLHYIDELQCFVLIIIIIIIIIYSYYCSFLLSVIIPDKFMLQSLLKRNIEMLENILYTYMIAVNGLRRVLRLLKSGLSLGCFCQHDTMVFLR